MTLLWDPKTNQIHMENCTRADAKQMVPCTLDSGLRKGYHPCDCCRDVVRRARVEKNQCSIRQAHFRFVFTLDSSVYHRPDCPCILGAKRIAGKQNYDKLVETGRHPCKRCKPEPPAHKPAGIEKPIALINNAYPFWAEKGYDTFHLTGCKSLKGMKQLHGYSHYRNAISAGLRPCRHCRPTVKYDPVPVIPVCGTPQEGETVEEILERCEKAGFIGTLRKSRLLILTPVGRWRMELDAMPITLEHINLIRDPYNKTEYHQQPRTFLSMLDAFRYIRKHDARLKSKVKNFAFSGIRY